MIQTIMDEYILPTLIRYIDSYHWSFSFSTQLINLYYGTEYTQRELKALYRQKHSCSGEVKRCKSC